MDIFSCLCVSDEAKHAAAGGNPAAAPESLLISHGMPCPENAETAAAGEKLVLDARAAPAAAAVIGEKVTAGVSPRRIVYPGKKRRAAAKALRRGLAGGVRRGSDIRLVYSDAALGAGIAEAPAE